MGMGYTYRCPKCKQEFNVFLGMGMLEFDLFNLDNEFNIINKYKNDNMANFFELKSLVKTTDIVLDNDYGYKVFICEECKNFDSKFDFKITSLKTQKLFTPKYLCENCNNEMRKLDKNEALYCQNCKDTKLEVIGNLIWD